MKRAQNNSFLARLRFRSCSTKRVILQIDVEFEPEFNYFATEHNAHYIKYTTYNQSDTIESLRRCGTLEIDWLCYGAVTVHADLTEEWPFTELFCQRYSVGEVFFENE